MKLSLGLLFLTSISYAACVGPYCYDDTGAYVNGQQLGVFASVSIINKAADIGSTALFVAPQTGLYVLEAYTVSVSTDGTAGTVSTNIQYTDDSGSNHQNSLVIADLTTLRSATNGSFPIELIKGSTLFYTTSNSGSYGTGKYNLYMTVKKS